jgi:diacylglycerol kinase (ATP)
MSQPVVPVILNPTSRSGGARQHQEAIVRDLAARGVTAQMHLTQSAAHATVLGGELARLNSMVVAAGGDGTVHDVANGILQSGAAASCALAVLPLGTGNDFAKVVAGAGNRQSALDVIANPHIVSFDVGLAEWPGGREYFINGMGTGIDVEVVRQLHRLPALPGPVKYLLGLFRALAVYQPLRLSAVLNGERLDRSVMMMAVGNGICQGGGFYLTPQASPQDGRLDLCVVAELPLWKVALVLPRVLRGTHAGHPLVTMRSLEHVRFEANGTAPLYFQLDGELRQPATAFGLDVTVQPGALRVATSQEVK